MKKKTIKIAHLYPDLLNLYGEYGNIRALDAFIKRQGLATEIVNLSLDDTKNFKKYDIYYMGSGIEENEFLVLSDLYDYKDQIKKAIEDGKMFLVTGNVMELFGKRIEQRDGPAIEGLGIFEYNAVCAKNRLVGELFYEFKELNEGAGRKMLGFKNCNCNIANNTHTRPFGLQDNIRYKNFFGMMFFGPVLIRNPYFTDYILEILFDNLGLDYVAQEDHIEYRAYKEFVKNFIELRNLD